MKILYVLHQFFPRHHTGTERLTLQIAKQLQKTGNFVYVLTYEADNLGVEDFIKIDENFLVKKYQVESIPVISLKKTKESPDIDVFNPKIEEYTRNIVKEFDLVHFTHPWHLGSVLKVCKKFKIPTILTLTDTWLLCPRNLLTINSKVCSGPEEGNKCIYTCNYPEKIKDRYNDAKFFFKNTDEVFSGSKFLISTFKENGWERKIHLNNFSIDYSYVRPKGDPDEIVFGFMGSLMWHKGLHVLLDAFKKVKNQNIKLKIFGVGAEGDSYAEKVLDSAKQDKRIEYCGIFEYSETPNVMNNISTIIVPSIHKENFPLTIQLALAYKKPVIATKIGGMPELIEDGINGYLFDLGNVDQLANILTKISDNPSLLNGMKKNIKNPPRVEEEAFEYERIYKELLLKNQTRSV